MNVRVHHARGAVPVALDPAIPCVTEILDENRLLEELARAFPERSFSEPTAVVDVSYTPRRALATAFEVTEHGRPTIIGIHAHPAFAGVPDDWPTRSAADVRTLSGWGALAWEFPADPGLPALARLVDTTAMSGVMRWLIGTTTDVITCTPLRYIAGRRAVVHITSAGHETVARHTSDASTHAEHELLMRLFADPERAFRMPEPLGYDERLQARFEVMVDGRRADELPVIGRSLPMVAVCSEIAALHRRPVDDGADTPRLGRGAILGQVMRVVQRRLSLAVPGLTRGLDGIVDGLRNTVGDLPAPHSMNLHGDLHGGNVLVDDSGPLLVGLETPVIGDPATDLALLGTSLYLAALQRGDSVRSVADFIEELPAAYSSVSGTPVDGRAFTWHVAASLIGWQADAALRVLAPHTDELVTVLAATASAVLRDGVHSGTLTAFVD